jgi:putative nucleotidyltransferase with HDIG domain
MNEKVLSLEDNFWTVISRPTRLTSKLITLGVLFFVLYLKLFDVFGHLKTPLVPDELYLIISLTVVIYIWIMDSIDTQRYLLSQNELITLQNRLKDEQMNTISSLILSQEAKDHYTQGHTARVMHYAQLLAEKLNLPKEEVEIIKRAARLHDIGKIGINDLILRKPGKLTDEERVLVRQHTALGDNILEPLEFLKKERKIVSQHHEHYDGTGYPVGVKGLGISIEARILAISDFLDAVSSDRPYRKALSRQEIIDELRKNKGKQFDPQLVDILLELIEKEDSRLKEIAQLEK